MGQGIGSEASPSSSSGRPLEGPASVLPGLQVPASQCPVSGRLLPPLLQISASHPWLPPRRAIPSFVVLTLVLFRYIPLCRTPQFRCEPHRASFCLFCLLLTSTQAEEGLSLRAAQDMAPQAKLLQCLWVALLWTPQVQLRPPFYHRLLCSVVACVFPTQPREPHGCNNASQRPRIRPSHFTEENAGAQRGPQQGAVAKRAGNSLPSSRAWRTSVTHCCPRLLFTVALNT